MAGCVTIEWSVGFVRLHDGPAEFGEYAPFTDGFALVQVEPGIFEAKMAADLEFTADQHRDLAQKLAKLPAKEVFYWRHKPGRKPYKVRIKLPKALQNNPSG